MPAPNNYHGLPPIDSASKGNTQLGKEQDIYNAAELIRPRNTNMEPKVATMSRVAVRVLDRETGKAMDVAEIARKAAENITAADITGLGTAATADTGTTEGSIPVLGAGGKLASSLLPDGGGGEGDYLPLAGGTMDAGADIAFANFSAIREAGTQGLEIECSVGYRWQWVAGRMILRQINSGQIARIIAIDGITPGATHDITEGFVPGTRWETVDGTVYTCTDSTEDAAVWEVTPIGGSGFTDTAGTGPANFPHGLTAQENTTLAGITETVLAIGNSGTTKTLNIASETFQTVTLTGNCVFTMPTATAGKSFTLKVITGAGGFAATFTGVKWPENIAPVITSTAGRYDLISFIADGTAWSGSAIQNFTP